MKKRTLAIGLLSLAFSIWQLRSAWSAEGHEHKEGPAVKIPATVASIWSEVSEHQEELGKIIADKNLDKVHEAAFEIRDLVNALPDKSKDLPADKLAMVKSNAKFVTDLADRLDKSGDANDQAGTEANFKKLQGFLKIIEAQYPAETLKASAGKQAQSYTCPMCGGSFDKPGKCPMCRMNLVERSAEPHADAQPHRDHDARHGGVFTMVGDSHLELVERDNEFRVFVYDAYTKPVSVAGLHGKLEFEEASGATPPLDLLPAASAEYLVAPRRKGFDPSEATVRLPFRGANLMVTLPLRITLTGRVVDMACFARDGAGALESSHDECARACIAAGSPVGILIGKDAKEPLYLITLRGNNSASKAANDKLMALANKEVHITGRIIQRGKLVILEMSDVQVANELLGVAP